MRYDPTGVEKGGLVLGTNWRFVVDVETMMYELSIRSIDDDDDDDDDLLTNDVLCILQL